MDRAVFAVSARLPRVLFQVLVSIITRGRWGSSCRSNMPHAAEGRRWNLGYKGASLSKPAPRQHAAAAKQGVQDLQGRSACMPQVGGGRWMPLPVGRRTKNGVNAQIKKKQSKQRAGNDRASRICLCAHPGYFCVFCFVLILENAALCGRLGGTKRRAGTDGMLCLCVGHGKQVAYVFHMRRCTYVYIQAVSPREDKERLCSLYTYKYVYSHYTKTVYMYYFVLYSE